MGGDGWGDDADGWGTTETSTSGFDSNNNESKSRGGSGCRKCGEEGHFARDCPKGGGSGCHGCGEEGHMKRDCPKGGGSACHGCGEEGHMKRDCPKKKPGSNKCFNCDSEDHMSRDCPEPKKCKRCKSEDHESKDCDKPMETRKVMGEDGTEREIYVPSEIVEEKLFEQGISSGINFDRFDKIAVQCTGNQTVQPIKSFEDAKLRTLLIENILKSKYTKPTPVQKHAIPIIMEGRDLMACAQTGSGKTAAFLLPILNNLLKMDLESKAGDSPQKPNAVIVAPTRELAIQIKDECRKFASGSMIKSVVAYGGTSVGFQLSTLFKGVHVLIATPGRLMGFVDQGKVSFEEVSFFVLDEADRMLDMGFLPEVKRICAAAGMPPKGERQTLMFSATFPPEIQELAAEYLENYLFLSVGIVGAASEDVKQVLYQVPKFEKRDKVKEMLDELGEKKTMVFVETKKQADFLATFLCEAGYPTTSIHGDRLQREREMALGDFRSGNKPVLVATAVAARGLDIKGVDCVINYDLPKSIDEYVHRIGRTGRVGNTGRAVSFYDSEHDEHLAADIVKIFGNAQIEVPEFLLQAAKGGGGGPASSGFGGKDIRKNAKQQKADSSDDEDWG